MPNQHPHGIAMGSASVGPQERPKGEYVQNPMTHSAAMGYSV
ncbi:MAG: hypothetical protein ACP5U1_17505 [Desulfomonilaceae bacterium]